MSLSKVRSSVMIGLPVQGSFFAAGQGRESPKSPWGI